MSFHASDHCELYLEVTEYYVVESQLMLADASLFRLSGEGITNSGGIISVRCHACKIFF